MTISTTTLKNAARAIECDLWTDSDGANYLAKDGAILRRWEPLEDDGDAFRLMVALRAWQDCDDDICCVENPDDYDGDDCKAARHAIVRAAAEFGAKR
jgi:hypothetical protein